MGMGQDWSSEYRVSPCGENPEALGRSPRSPPTPGTSPAASLWPAANSFTRRCQIWGKIRITPNHSESLQLRSCEDCEGEQNHESLQEVIWDRHIICIWLHMYIQCLSSKWMLYYVVLTILFTLYWLCWNLVKAVEVSLNLKSSRFNLISKSSRRSSVHILWPHRSLWPCPLTLAALIE